MLKQFVRPVLGLLTTTLVFQVMSLSAFAQLSSAISPWMGMFDRDRNGAFGNPYLDVVKPQQNMQKAYSAQASQLQAQQRALQAMQGGGSGGLSGSGDGTGARNLMSTSSSGGTPSSAPSNLLLAPPREIPSTQRNPAVFNQYLHYYTPYALPRQPVPNFSSTGRRR